MSNILTFQKPARVSISPAVRAEAIAWLLRERDATARSLARLDEALAEVAGRNKENDQ
jgi:hypothetical protein